MRVTARSMAVGTVACGDPVGQRVELGDELVVGDRVGGCAVRLVDADAMHLAVIGGDGEVGARSAR